MGEVAVWFWLLSFNADETESVGVERACRLEGGTPTLAGVGEGVRSRFLVSCKRSTGNFELFLGSAVVARRGCDWNGMGADDMGAGLGSMDRERSAAGLGVMPSTGWGLISLATAPFASFRVRPSRGAEFGSSAVPPLDASVLPFFAWGLGTIASLEFSGPPRALSTPFGSEGSVAW